MEKGKEKSSPEWSEKEWVEEWTVKVGKAYSCSLCGNIVMVTKGGVGVMEPRCCGEDMGEVGRVDDIR